MEKNKQTSSDALNDGSLSGDALAGLTLAEVNTLLQQIYFEDEGSFEPIWNEVFATLRNVIVR